jgi:hypothetical protein
MNMTNNNNDDDEMETESLAIVKRMFEQYPNNPNMKQKIHHYIKNLLEISNNYFYNIIFFNFLFIIFL